MADAPETTPVPLSDCLNCGAPVAGRYCAGCRQPTKVPVLTFRGLAGRLVEYLFDLNGKVPRTIIDMTVRPGKVIADFNAGNRVRYIGPVRYLIWLLTIYLIVFKVFGASPVDLLSGQQPNLEAPGMDPKLVAHIQEASIEVGNFILKYFQPITMLMLPIQAFFLWVFFRKKRFNFLQHLVAIFYANAQPVILLILAQIVFVLTGDFILQIVASAFNTFYVLWVSANWLKPRKFSGWISIFLALVCYLIVLGIIAAVAVNLYIVLTWEG